jgi:hypothetical protein
MNCLNQEVELNLIEIELKSTFASNMYMHIFFYMYIDPRA